MINLIFLNLSKGKQFTPFGLLLMFSTVMLHNMGSYRLSDGFQANLIISNKAY